MNDISGGVVTSIIGKLGLDNGVELVRHTSIESQFYELERSSIISFPFEHLISKNIFPVRESSFNFFSKDSMSAYFVQPTL